MQSVLITGFEPFGEHTSNPSEHIAERLNGETIGNARVSSLVLPVRFGDDTRLMFSEIERVAPIAILSFGLDASADGIKVEMFAVNHRIADDGLALTSIVEDGPAAYFATIDVDVVAAEIETQAGLPARAHGYAGSYLCNHIFYQTLHFIAENQIDCKMGFIHVPPATEQKAPADQYPESFALDRLIEAATIAAGAVVNSHSTSSGQLRMGRGDR